MCGIYGWVPETRFRMADWPSVIDRVGGSLRHRGPNDQGHCLLDGHGDLHADPPSARSGMPFRLLLGQTRLSIIDLSLAGHQPMLPPNRDYAITYNGEIYNYKELKLELQSLGVVFRSESDTEVLLWSYIKWGKDCLRKLNGMYAFSVYDHYRSSLFCARDCFGIKPFFYTEGPSGFCFASELDALLSFPGVPRRLNWQKAYDYLQFCAINVGHDTMVENVKHLPPAHYMEVDVPSGKVRELRRYWAPYLGSPTAMSYPEATERFRGLLLDSVRLHLRSDVPIGIAVSGGIDSSAIACGVRKIHPEANINTFSFVAKGTDVSEESWIGIVNRTIGAQANTVFISPEDIVVDLDGWILRQGEPVNNTSMYAQYRVFRLAKERGVTVTLDGQGADELLGGYDGYAHARILSMLRRGQFGEALRLLLAQSQWPGRSRMRTFSNILKQVTPEWAFWVGALAMGRPMRPKWMGISNFRDHDIRWRWFQDKVYDSKDKLRETLAYEATWRCLPNLLRYGDRSSMSWSIESRVPFCTRPIADFVLSLPEEYLVGSDGLSKRLLRDSMRGIVPDAILDRRDKIGFATPEFTWMKSLDPWVGHILSEGGDSSVIDSKVALTQWRNIMTGVRNYDWTVWRWINYLRWKSLFRITE